MGSLVIAVVSASLTVMQLDLRPLTVRTVAPLAAQKLELVSVGTADTALEVIGIAKGSDVAQVGVAAGNFVLRLAQRVGAEGRVYASDSQKANLDRLKRSLASHSLNNVKLVLGTGQDPRLPAGKLDLVLLVGIYHELAQPQDMLRKLRDALKPAGRLVLVEYRQDDPSAPVRAGQKLTIQDFKSEIEPAGYRYEKVLGVLPRQHILVFVRN